MPPTSALLRPWERFPSEGSHDPSGLETDNAPCVDPSFQPKHAPCRALAGTRVLSVSQLSQLRHQGRASGQESWEGQAQLPGWGLHGGVGFALCLLLALTHLLTHLCVFSHSVTRSLIRLHWVLGAGSVLQEYFAAPPDVTTVTPAWICQGLTQSQTLSAPFRAGSLLSWLEAALWVRPPGEHRKHRPVSHR